MAHIRSHIKRAGMLTETLFISADVTYAGSIFTGG